MYGGDNIWEGTRIEENNWIQKNYGNTNCVKTTCGSCFCSILQEVAWEAYVR